MEPKPNIYQRILGVMGDLSYIQKGDKTVNGQYRFASHDQVTAALHPMLVKHGLLAIPSIMALEQEGNRTKAQISMNFINVDNPTETVSVVHYGYGVDSGDKGPGKAVSYATKYAYLKTFCLETGEDPDQDAKALYEPPKCLEFDLAIPAEFKPADRRKMNAFLQECSESTGKNVEEIKREAVQRMEGFLEAFKKWSTKK